MNPMQLTRQLRATLRAVCWSQDPGGLIFGDQVHVTAADLPAIEPDLRGPSKAFIRPLSVRYHPQIQRLVEEATWELTLVVVATADRFGEAAVIGAQRLSLGTTTGRGLEQVETELVRSLSDMTTTVVLKPRHASAARVDALAGTVVVARTYEVIAYRIPAESVYASARRILWTTNTTTLSWRLPPLRYDLFSLMVRRIAGSTAPTIVTSGTLVPLPSAPTIGPGVGLAGLGSGSLTAGAYSYKVTFVTAAAESAPSPASSTIYVSDPTTDGRVALTSVPLGGTSTASRKIYRSAVGQPNSAWYLLATISDNTTSTYSDNNASVTTEVSKLPISVVDSGGGSGNSYSVFLGYDEDGDGVVDRYSSPATLAV